MVTTALLLSVLLTAGDSDAPAPVKVEVGQRFELCKAGLIVCPVSTSVCDAPAIAVVENGADGAVVKGVSPGTTLCSVRGPGAAFFRLMRVTVVPPPASGPASGGTAGAPRPR
jgi:hypothetical protein